MTWPLALSFDSRAATCSLSFATSFEEACSEASNSARRRSTSAARALRRLEAAVIVLRVEEERLRRGGSVCFDGP